MKIEKSVSVKNCKKCGSNVFTQTYGDFTGKRKYVPASVGTDGKLIPEHLEVTCNACGYAWQEECSDVIQESY